MKLPQRPERPSNQFEGRTPEEAVRLARREFGREATLRCWKIRSGGVLGFFAREAYVAGVTPPPGAIKAVKTSRPAKDKEPKKEPSIPAAQEGASLPAAVGASLSKLVEETSDSVSLGADQVPAAVFSEVLAEAQAAVGGAGSLVAPQLAEPPGPVLADPPQLADLPQLADPPRLAELATPGERTAPTDLAWATRLEESLVRFGVPARFRPNANGATLDDMARALGALPQPDPLPGLGGSVIVVVGGRRDAHLAARAVVAMLGLADSDLVGAERTDAGRQRVARRRLSNKVTVLVVEATVRSRNLTAVASWIDKVRPDYVIGAVPAVAKRSDVASWGARLGHVDSLALSRLADTATPGELMGLLPIALLDGDEASTLRWMVTLLGTELARLS